MREGYGGARNRSYPWNGTDRIGSDPTIVSRDRLANEYFEQLRFEPYPVQEEALLAWFTSAGGVLVCAPTGTGKTLIAEAAIFEALKTGRRAYYTTPLIALTEQKLRELQSAVQHWGYSEQDVGLVTGNRQVNPQAPILVVVAEILFNRLLHGGELDDDRVSAVVMDEFHSFNDPQRGIVWELTLGLLPAHVRMLLLSATVGSPYEFVRWLATTHQRRLELVQTDDRKVPLSFHWVGDQLLSEQLEEMARGDEETRRTPTLVFCFNREECWTIAEQLKGKKLLAANQQQALVAELEHHDWSQGAGPKLRQLLIRGVGVHHAGVLPRYKRIVEDLFQRKLLTVTVCTETLAAGINLPARSVVLPSLLKGPPRNKRLLEASAAHQMFGRAGRPQFDVEGHVYGLAHEDDVKIGRWREKFDLIPADTKDPGLRKAKKALKKKMPKRRSTQQYWEESQFSRLIHATPGKLQSRGSLPWRLLAYLLEEISEVDRIREMVKRRLVEGKQQQIGQQELDRMLLTLQRAGYVDLEPKPPATEETTDTAAAAPCTGAVPKSSGASPEPPPYQAQIARPRPELKNLLVFRGAHPLYGAFLIKHLGIADRCERIQAMESILAMPRSVGPQVRVPGHEELPPGPLAIMRLDVQLLQMGLADPGQLSSAHAGEEEDPDGFAEERVYVLTLAEKLRLLFDYEFPGVHGLVTVPVWAAGELLQWGGDFNQYVTAKRLQKQEGVIFRHLLRLLLLIGEFAQLTPPETSPQEWRDALVEIQGELERTCRQVDPTSTDKMMAETGTVA